MPRSQESPLPFFVAMLALFGVVILAIVAWFQSQQLADLTPIVKDNEAKVKKIPNEEKIAALVRGFFIGSDGKTTAEGVKLVESLFLEQKSEFSTAKLTDVGKKIITAYFNQTELPPDAQTAIEKRIAAYLFIVPKGGGGDRLTDDAKKIVSTFLFTTSGPTEDAKKLIGKYFFVYEDKKDEKDKKVWNTERGEYEQVLAGLTDNGKQIIEQYFFVHDKDGKITGLTDNGKSVVGKYLYVETMRDTNDEPIYALTDEGKRLLKLNDGQRLILEVFLVFDEHGKAIGLTELGRKLVAFIPKDPDQPETPTSGRLALELRPYYHAYKPFEDEIFSYAEVQEKADKTYKSLKVAIAGELKEQEKLFIRNRGKLKLDWRTKTSATAIYDDKPIGDVQVAANGQHIQFTASGAHPVKKDAIQDIIRHVRYQATYKGNASSRQVALEIELVDSGNNRSLDKPSLSVEPPSRR